MLEVRQEEARELRKNHEKAVAELKAEMAEKKRRGKEGVAAKLQVGSVKHPYELIAKPCHVFFVSRRAMIVGRSAKLKLKYITINLFYGLMHDGCA